MTGVKQLKKKSGSIYSDVEELVLEPWQRMRQRFLSPIAFVLARLGISADMLSFASVVLGIGFFLYAPFQFTVAFWFLIASLVCDSLDGVEARLTGTNTMRGSFTDVFCDQLVVAFTVAGMAWKGLIQPALAVIWSPASAARTWMGGPGCQGSSKRTGELGSPSSSPPAE